MHEFLVYWLPIVGAPLAVIAILGALAEWSDRHRRAAELVAFERRRYRLAAFRRRHR